jgi:hypothetical protein
MYSNKRKLNLQLIVGYAMVIGGALGLFYAIVFG